MGRHIGYKLKISLPHHSLSEKEDIEKKKISLGIKKGTMILRVNDKKSYISSNMLPSCFKV